MIARLERLAIVAALLGTAWTVAAALRPPAHAETRHVTIPGEEADTLAETIAEAEGALTPVRTHDGRELWVRESALGGASLVPGNAVLVQRDGQLSTASVIRSLDDFVELDLEGLTTIVPAHDVLARLHHGPDVSPPPSQVSEPPLPPPTPLAQMISLQAAPLSRSASLESCEAGIARVVYPDGTDSHVPISRVHPLRVHAGDHVTALWNESPYPGVIVDARDSLVRVRWDDASEQWIEPSEVQSVQADATGAIQGCPRGTVLVDEGPRAHVGRILSCDGAFATVLDAEGAPRQIPRASATRVPLRVGDAIEAKWNGTPYAAFVMSIGERIHVRWYDGSEGDVDPADLVTFRTSETRESEPASCPDV